MDDSALDLAPWEHQPGEHPRDYHVFELFCQLGPERSVRLAAEKWFAETKHPLPKNPGARFNNVAVQWRWQERADWYWRAERRRAERLLQERRNAIYARIAAAGERALSSKYEKGLEKVKADVYARQWVEGLGKLHELMRSALGDSDEERKHRGRPSEQDGGLPSVDDRLKPAEEEGNDGQGRSDGQDQNE